MKLPTNWQGFELSSVRDIAHILSGAPLDFVKVVAAILMVIDHVNYVFIARDPNVIWYLGRPVYPLFAFALACNLLRGATPWPYVQRLVLIGVISQPIFSSLMPVNYANILFTLAAGACVIVALRSQPLLVQHLVFLVATLLIFSTLLRVRGGLDYGLAGVLLPAALYLILEGRTSHVIWLAFMLFGLNWTEINDPWSLRPLLVAFIAGAGGILVLLAARAFKERPRFLPRYALHVFYPGHLLVLLTIYRWF
jgi:hypothetical protein